MTRLGYLFLFSTILGISFQTLNGLATVRSVAPTAEWQLAARWPIEGDGVSLLPDAGLDIAYAPDGRLLVAGRTADGSSAVHVTAFGRMGDILQRWPAVAAGLRWVDPAGMAVDPASDDVLVGDWLRARLLRYDASGETRTPWSPSDSRPGAKLTCDMAVGGGLVYLLTQVGVAGGGDVLADVWDMQGNWQRRFRVFYGSTTLSQQCAAASAGGYQVHATVDRSGRLYASSTYTPLIARFESGGGHDFWQAKERGPIMAAHPAADEIYVYVPSVTPQTVSAAIVVYDTDGRRRRTLPAPALVGSGQGDAPHRSPSDVRLAVADDGGYAVLLAGELFVYTAEGSRRWIGRRDEVQLPPGRLDVGADGKVWVHYQGRITVLGTDGAARARWPAEPVQDVAAEGGDVLVQTPALLTRYAADGTLIWRRERPPDPRMRLALAGPDLLASLPLSRTVDTLDPRTGDQRLRSRPMRGQGDWPVLFAAAPDGSVLTQDPNLDYRLRLWAGADFTDARAVVTLPVNSTLRALALGADGSIAAITDRHVRLFDGSGSPLAAWAAGTTITDAAFGPDGWLYLFDSAGPEVRVFAPPGTVLPTATPSPTATLPLPSPATPSVTAVASATDTATPLASPTATTIPTPPSVCLPWLAR